MLGGGGRSLLSRLRNLVLHKITPKLIPSLPDELYLDIFIRLPVKAVFTCKCVSKTWFSIISSPHFIKLHLNYTLKFSTSGFIVSGYDNKIHDFLMYNITKHSLFSTRKFYGKSVLMEYNQSRVFDTFGSCNGLVCLREYYDPQFPEFIIWNPATREYKRIPYDSRVISRARLCYDYMNDDYKIVSAAIAAPSFTVYVYTLRSNSWKCLQAKPYSVVGSLTGALVNGALHWITKTPKVIVSFNISDERFNEIQLPGEMTETMLHSHVFLKVLEGCLCVVHAGLNKAWVMREYGNWESWEKHQNKTALEYYHLMWSSVNGEFLIYGQNNVLGLYDLKHSTVKRLNLGSLDIRGVDNYVESLVSLDTGTYFGRTKVTGTQRGRK